MYDYHFINFGRPPIPDDFLQRFSPKASSVLEKLFKGFYHIWAWRPSWSIDRNHFSNLSLPQPKEAPQKIWATLAQRLQRRSLLKFSTFFPYKCIGKQIFLPRLKKVKRQRSTITLATWQTSIPLWFVQRFSLKASSVLKKKTFKGFYHIWAWRPS